MVPDATNIEHFLTLLNKFCNGWKSSCQIKIRNITNFFSWKVRAAERGFLGERAHTLLGSRCPPASSRDTHKRGKPGRPRAGGRRWRVFRFPTVIRNTRHAGFKGPGYSVRFIPGEQPTLRKANMQLSFAGRTTGPPVCNAEIFFLAGGVPICYRNLRIRPCNTARNSTRVPVSGIWQRKEHE
jgi:hypothetical protein